MRRHVLCFVVGSAAAIAGCSGGGGSSTAAPPVAAGPAAVPLAKTSVPVTFSVQVPGSGTKTATRSPMYVSSYTHSVQVGVTQGSTVVSPPVQSQCGGSPDVCTVTVNAPIGSDTFAVSLFSSSNALLSAGTLTATVVEGTANAFSVTFDPVLADISLSFDNDHAATYALTAGDPETLALLVYARDAAGRYIVGPGNFINSSGQATPVSLTSSTSLTGVAITPASITAPNPASTPLAGVLAYDGTPPRGHYFTTVTPIVSGITTTPIESASVTLQANFDTFVASTVPNGSTSSNIVVGPDQRLWTGLYGSCQTCATGQTRSGYLFAVDSASRTGVSYQVPSGGFVESVGPGSDGNVWFTERLSNSPATYGIGYITPGGAITEFPLPTSDAIYAFGNDQVLAGGTDHNEYVGGTQTVPGDPAQNVFFKVGPGGVLGVIPLNDGGQGVREVTNGPSGSVWFISEAQSGRHFGSVATSGFVHEVGLTSNFGYRPGEPAGHPSEMFFYGGDGNFYSSYFRITPTGLVSNAFSSGSTHYVVQAALNSTFAMCLGPTICKYSDGSGTAVPFVNTASINQDLNESAVLGPDGGLWYSGWVNGPNGIARLNW